MQPEFKKRATGNTEAKITLFNRSNIFDPCAVAPFDPMNKLPIEQIERSRSELWLLGLKVGAWRIGNIGLNFVKNS
jgi:hypothetical protein